MKIMLAIALAAITVRAALGPHAVSRTLISEDDTAVAYKDKMSDGTYRDSQVVKPKIVLPTYPGRITLVGTNDTPRFFELVYESVYDGGQKATNYTAVLKDKRDIIKDRLALPPMPEESTNAPARTDAFAVAKNRMIGQPVSITNKVVRMAPYQPRLISSMMANGKVVRTMSDGHISIEPLRLAHTARVSASPSGPSVKPPPGNKYNARELAAFAAGAAAALAAYGIKKAI